MRDRFPLVLIGGLLLLGALGSFVLEGARRGAFADRLSTYRSEKDGARALYLLLEANHLQPSRLQNKLDVIDPALNLVLLGVAFEDEHAGRPSKTGFSSPADGGAPDEPLSDAEKEDLEARGFNALRAPPLGKEEVDALLEHLRNGATVVYLPWGANDNELLTAVGLHLTRAEKQLDLRTLFPAQPSPWTRGVERAETRVQAFLELPERGVPLLVDDTLDLVAAALVPYGQGRLVVVTAPELAMNVGLARADNAQLWRSLAREASRSGPLAFDEFHHGFTADRSLGAFAARHGLQLAAAQLLLGVILWAASLRRLGPPKHAREEARIGATDALSATSRLYREGHHFQHAAGCITRQLSAELAPLAGASARATPDEVSASLDLKGRKDLARSLLELTRDAGSASSDHDVLRVATRAASLRTTLQDARTRRTKR